MADFTRFISYFYDYREGERNRNLGFAKVESRQGMCRVTVCLNHGQVLKRSMMLCGYMAEPRGVYLVRLGEMERGTRERQWKFPADNLGGCGVRAEQLDGLILVDEDRTLYLLSVWNDKEKTADDIRRGQLLRAPGRTGYADAISEDAGESMRQGGRTGESLTQEEESAREAPWWNAAEISAHEEEGWNAAEISAREEEGWNAAGNSTLEAAEQSIPEEISPLEAERRFASAERVSMGMTLTGGETGASQEKGEAEAAGTNALQEKVEAEAAGTNALQEKVEAEAVGTNASQEKVEAEAVGTNASQRKEEPASADRNAGGEEAALWDSHTRYQTDRENDRIAAGSLSKAPDRITARQSVPVRQSFSAGRSSAAATAPEEWKKLCSIFPAAKPFEPSAWEVLCISLQDIGRLPPENWVWGSNHFLLHAFYQYRHLILARQRIENKVYLGVPGEFGVNEKFMAGMFGLHRFERERKGKSDKGYWLAPVRL